AAGQGRARDRVIAALERAGSVDQQVDAGGREGCGEVRGIEVQALRAHRVGPGAAGVHEGAGTAQVAPGDQDLAAAIGRERAGDAAAEMTVAAEDEDAHGAMLAAPAALTPLYRLAAESCFHRHPPASGNHRRHGRPLLSEAIPMRMDKLTSRFTAALPDAPPLAVG